MNTTQTWTNFISGIQQATNQYKLLLIKERLLRSGMELAASNPATTPPPELSKSMVSIANAMAATDKNIRALQVQRQISEQGMSAIMPSQTYPGDLDIVPQKEIPEAVMNASRFNRVNINLSDELLGAAPVIPLVIKAVAWTGGALIASGIISEVTETMRGNEEIKLKLAKTEAELTKVMAKDKQSFSMWAQMKGKAAKAAEEAEKGFGQIAAESIGGALGVAAIALVGYLIYKYVSEKK